MVIEPGDKLLVSHRRLFAEDHPRYFTGLVEACEDGFARVTGHSWVREQLRGTMMEKCDLRTKVIALGSSGLMIYMLPRGTDLDALHIEEGDHHSAWLTDGADLHMDLSDRRAIPL